jgi:hypothetical protein
MEKLAWIKFEPSLEEGSRARGFLLAFAASLSRSSEDSHKERDWVEQLRIAALLNRDTPDVCCGSLRPRRSREARLGGQENPDWREVGKAY